jgi:glycosyltransferase involved in cell wall biosynthesis
MKIAQLAPLAVSIPPVRYGGTERMISALTEELVRRGHDVTLFAAGGSRTRARLRRGSPRPLWEMEVRDPLAYLVAQIEDLVQQSSAFDVIHSHVDYLPWLAGDRLGAPAVTTLHGRLDLPELAAVFTRFRDQALVSISESQRHPVAELDLNWAATVYHGLPLRRTYRLGDGGGGYLAFVGRCSPEKDPATAIKVAIRAGLTLKIAARVDRVDEAYHRTQVEPLLDHPLVEWLGEIGESEKARLFAGARALLLPIAWKEPFGLTFIEALAAGTPVITRPLGSIPELLVDGEHGFLGTGEEELAEACQRAATLDRAACRRWALSRFSVERMTDDYEAVYRALTRGRRPGLEIMNSSGASRAIAGPHRGCLDRAVRAPACRPLPSIAR